MGGEDLGEGELLGRIISGLVSVGLGRPLAVWGVERIDMFDGQRKRADVGAGFSSCMSAAAKCWSKHAHTEIISSFHRAVTFYNSKELEDVVKTDKTEMENKKRNNEDFAR